MPQWWKDRAKHIRKKNPSMPEGMEWALATEQYKKEFGRPPKHKKKSSIKGNAMLNELVKLADVLDTKGLHADADVVDRIAAGRFDPMTNPLPSKVKEVIDNPVFKLAVKSGDFTAAKDLALSVVMESEIKDADKQRFLYNIENIGQAEYKSDSEKAAELQKYLYNSWLKYIGLSVGALEQLVKLADHLDGKGLLNEANHLDSLIQQVK